MRISDWSSDVCSSDLVMTRPVVGITTWKRGVSSVLGPGQPAHTLGVEYAAAVERAGATVVLLPPTPGGADVLDRLDGLVLSGGEDVRPERYGGIPQPDIEYDDARDAHGSEEPTSELQSLMRISHAVFCFKKK